VAGGGVGVAGGGVATATLSGKIAGGAICPKCCPVVAVCIVHVQTWKNFTHDRPRLSGHTRPAASKSIGFSASGGKNCLFGNSYASYAITVGVLTAG
jgi:hypothetical protein